MAKVRCEVCGRNVNALMANYAYKNNMHQHKKCPKDANIIPEQESNALGELKDTIQWLTKKQNIYLSPAQWAKTTSQIKHIKEQGYSYEQQLTAFKWYFDTSKNNEYQGYGIIGYIIEQALHEVNNQNSTETKENTETALKDIMEKKRLERLGR